MPSGVGLPRYPEQLATPFLATGKLQINMGTGVRPVQSFPFVQTFQNQAAIRDHRKMEICCFALFGDIVLPLFCLVP